MNSISHSVFRCCGAIQLRSILLFVMLFISPVVKAAKVYQTSADFLNSQFKGAVPKAKFVNITDEMRQRISQMNGYSYRQSRVRYWEKGGISVWILEDIGKTRPITTAYVVNDGRIDSVKVLTYRESHGDEVARTFFTKQFRKVSMKSNFRLSKRPKNVAGATLSVLSLTRMARVALYLEKQQ